MQRGAAGADGPHRRRDAGEGLRGEVGVLVDEQVRALDVAVQRGEVQRRDAAAGRPVHEPAAVAGGRGQQQPGALDVPAGRCQVQRRPAAEAVHLRHLQPSRTQQSFRSHQRSACRLQCECTSAQL